MSSQHHPVTRCSLNRTFCFGYSSFSFITSLASPISPLQNCSPSLHSLHGTITQVCRVFQVLFFRLGISPPFAFPFYENKQFSQAPSSGIPRRRCTSRTGLRALGPSPLYRVSFDYISILPYSSWVTGARASWSRG